jgi:uncharacterized membrane protein YfcA
MKRVIIIVIIAMYAILMGGIVYFDFINFIPANANTLKYCTIVLSFLTAAFLWKDSFNRKDGTILLLGMFCTLITDIYMIFVPARLFVIGMMLYGQTMCVYFFRYQKAKWAVILPFFIYIPLILYYGFKVDLMTAAATFYIQVLITNIISIVRCIRKGKFPKINAILIVTSLIIFAMGDITVVLRNFPLFNIRLASKFIWLFYTPSQALLAFSAYDFAKSKASPRPGLHPSGMI